MDVEPAVQADRHAEPVVGLFALRTFRVSADGYLLPVGSNESSWLTGTCIAECGRNHPAPADDCTCGVYSLRNLHELRLQYWSSRRVVAVVALEGQTIEGAKGSRSQAARIVDLWIETGPRGLPIKQRDLLREHLPAVRFHTDLPQMLDRYPELIPSLTPRRDVLRQAAERWTAELKRTRPSARGTSIWTAAAMFFAVAWTVLGPWSGPSIAAAAGQLTVTALLAGTLIIFTELPALLGGLLIAGACPPVFLTSRRPVRRLWRGATALLFGGVLAALVAGQGLPVTGLAICVALGTLLVNLERFMLALSPGTRPLRMLIVARGAARLNRRREWIPERMPSSRWRYGRRGVAPVVLACPPPSTNPGA